MDCHEVVPTSRNDKNTESLRGEAKAIHTKINLCEARKPLSVVRGEGESCERGRGERLRVCAKHQPTLANSSLLALSQNKIISGEAIHQKEMNNCNEVAARIKKSENEAEQNIESNGLPRSLATSRNDENTESLKDSIKMRI